MTDERNEEDQVSERADALLPCPKWLDRLLGTLCAIICGVVFASYMQQLHEIKLWFSNIPLLHQEISLRTETGLYYSYYKSAVRENVPLIETIRQLMHDTSTEYPREINLLQRFNIYQELFLAAVYKTLKAISPLAEHLPSPMIFYVYSCFAFTGLGVTTLFLLVWTVHGSWIYGWLALGWMCANLDDSTRAFFSVNLREMFALPFFWLQNLFVVRILRSAQTTSVTDSIAFAGSTFLFALFWQFNQFILLVQSVSLFAIALLVPRTSDKVISLLISQSVAFTGVVIVQFVQPMALQSMCLSFNLAAIVVVLLTRHERSSTTNEWNPLLCVALKAVVTCIVCVVFNVTVKLLTGSESDTHIWTFVRAKLGFHNSSQPVPFETAVYLCHGAFDFIDKQFFERTSSTGCLPLYLMSLSLIIPYLLGLLVKLAFNSVFRDAWLHKLGPAMVYVTIQSLQCAVIAVFALRMKYLWFPQMIVVGIWTLSNVLPRYVAPRSGKVVALAVVLALLRSQYNVYKQQMEIEEEFYDPDTVELMEWIAHSTAPSSSWAGSMQLMAGVKACTGRNLANHPHFEDKWLRDRTLRLYQIYGRKPPEYVHRILREESVDYIIVEDSICLAPSNGCRTNDLVDLSNGMMPDSGYNHPGSTLSFSTEPRFCDRIRHPDKSMAHLFRPVFSNPTFRVYKVL